MGKQADELIAAIDQLPLRLDRDVDTRQEAGSLLTMLSLARVNDAAAGVVSTKQDGARRELLGLAEKLRSLNDHICSMHLDSLRSLRAAAEKHSESAWKLPEIEALQIHLKNTFDNTVRALRSTPHQVSRGGRPKKIAASIVADFTRVSFESVTGRPASLSIDPITSVAGGPFHKFLAEVFRISGVDASPERQARDAIDRAKAGIAPGSQATMMTIRRIPKEETAPISPG